MSKTGIYSIVHKDSQKRYIGSAVCTQDRWATHRSQLRAGKHHSRKLQRAWDKYGEDAFEFVVVESVESRDALIAREQYWIDFFSTAESGYNILPTAGSMLGMRHTEAAKRLMSETRKGRSHAPHTKEAKQKMSAAALGRVMSAESIKKTADKNRGKKRSAEYIAKRAGVKATPEHRAKISAALIGKKKTPEHVAKMIAAFSGKTASVETREKMSQAHKARWTPELRAITSASRKGRPRPEEANRKQSESMRLCWLRKRESSAQQPVTP